MTKPVTEDDPTLCREIDVQLPALLAGDLDADTRAEIERHLSFCPGCQFEWRAHELVWRCLAHCEDVDPPGELRKRVLEAIEDCDRARGKR